MHSLLSSSVVISTTLGFNLREVDQESKGLNHFGTVCVCVQATKYFFENLISKSLSYI